MKSLYVFAFILGLVLSLEAIASPDMTHDSGGRFSELTEEGFEKTDKVEDGLRLSE